jgi:Tfp pilus assembly protein PilN
MKTVNLLPNWYIAERRARRTFQLQMIGVFAGTAVAAAALVGLRVDVSHLDHESTTLAAQVAARRGVTIELAHNEEQLRKMERQQVACRDVGVPVPMSRVTQQVLNNLTPGTALSDFAIDVHQGLGKAGDSGGADDAKPGQVAQLTIDGIAPDSVRIAQLVGKLSANPLFSEITLNFSRTELIRDYSVKRFEILLQLDLNQLAIPDAADDGATARNTTAGGPNAG